MPGGAAHSCRALLACLIRAEPRGGVDGAALIRPSLLTGQIRQPISRRDPVAEQMSEATEARAGVEAIEASLEDD
jgi:hypothetical protein